MFLLPYQKRSFTTTLPIAGDRSVLEESISRKEWWGKLTAQGFRLVRRSKGTNTYNPWLLGRLRKTEQGATCVEITFTLHPDAIFVVILMFGWIEFLVVAKEPSSWWSPPLILAAFHCVMYVVGFQPEPKKAVSSLQSLLSPRQ
jgi:hypothetical protein